MKKFISETQIGGRESFSMIFILITSKMFCSYLPSAIAAGGGSVWYSALLSVFSVYFIFYFINSTGLDLFGLFDKSFGKHIGKAVQIVFSVYFFVYSAMSLHENIKIIKIYNFRETDAKIFAAVMLAVAVFVCLNGISGAARLSEFYIKLIFLTFLFIFIFGAGQYNFLKIFPLLGNGTAAAVKESLCCMSVFSDVILLMFLKKDCGGTKSISKTVKVLLLFSGIIVMLSSLFYGCVYDYSVSANKISGLLELVKNVYRGRIIQRVESFFFLMMTVIFSASVCILFSSAVQIFSKTFKISDFREILIPSALFVYGICMSVPFNADMNLFLKYGGMFMLIFCFLSAVFYKFGCRKCIKTAAVLLCVSLLSGCADMREVSDEAYAILLSVDKGEFSDVKLSAAIPSYESDDESVNEIYSVESENVSEGLNKLNMVLARKVSLIHLKAVIFSEELAKEGLYEYALPIQRHIDVQNAMGVMISEGSAKDKLSFLCDSGNGNISKETELLLLSKNYNSFYPVVMFDTFCDNMISPYASPVCAFGGNDEEIINGIALFDEDKLTGKLSVEEASYFMLAGGSSDGSVFSFSDGVCAEITCSESKITVNDNNISVMITANGICDDKISLFEAEKRVSEEISTKTGAVLRKILRCGCDALGFRGYAAKNYADIGEWRKYIPREDDINVEVNLSLTRSVNG